MTARPQQATGFDDARYDADFARSLARSIGVRLVVLVPASRRPRTLWTAKPDEQSGVEFLERIGRGWLAAPGTTDEFPHVLAIGIGADAAHRLGALVIAKAEGIGWTDEERTLAGFTAEFYGPDLSRLAVRPAPTSRFDEIDTVAVDRRDLEDGLRTASSRGELYVLYQPEVDLGSSEIVAAEALVRWHHPERGELAPEAFIGVAEETGLITVLGAWVLDAALRSFAGWTSTLPDLDVVLRVNVSPGQVADPSFVDLVVSALAVHGVPAHRLCIELTETFRVADVEVVRAALQRLRALGVTSAMDDLGAGYSSLSSLRLLPVDVVKVDRSIVAGIDADDRARAMVVALVSLSEVLGLDLVAEGVERSEEADVLARLGCTRAQGHLYGRAMDSAAMTSDLARRGRRRTAETTV